MRSSWLCIGEESAFRIRIASMPKRVYKFTSAHYGLSNLRSGKLRLSTIDDLNDPFDLTSIDITDPAVDQALEGYVRRMRGHIGILCFSRNWDNLLFWSHYGASHTGICLGFDIPDDYDVDVSLPAERHPDSRPPRCE